MIISSIETLNEQVCGEDEIWNAGALATARILDVDTVLCVLQ